MGEALQALEFIDQYGLIGVLLVIGLGLWWLDASSKARFSEIERRLEVLTVEFRYQANQLNTHLEHDREDFARLRARLDAAGA